MNKEDVIKLIHIDTGLSRSVCIRCLNSYINVIKNSLNLGECIQFNGFGKWLVKERKARLMYMPNMNNYIKVTRKYLPKFFISKSFSIKVK